MVGPFTLKGKLRRSSYGETRSLWAGQGGAGKEAGGGMSLEPRGEDGAVDTCGSCRGMDGTPGLEQSE